MPWTLAVWSKAITERKTTIMIKESTLQRLRLVQWAEMVNAINVVEWAIWQGNAPLRREKARLKKVVERERQILRVDFFQYIDHRLKEGNLEREVGKMGKQRE